MRVQLSIFLTHHAHLYFCSLSTALLISLLLLLVRIPHRIAVDLSICALPLPHLLVSLRFPPHSLCRVGDGEPPAPILSLTL